MNIRFIALHVRKDLIEIVSKLVHGRFLAAWCALRTHGRNAALVVFNRKLPPRAECPCCGWKGFGFRSVDGECMVFHDAECPRCISHERHRFLQLYLDRRPFPFATPCRLLHVAPERPLSERLAKTDGVDLMATDLMPDKLAPLRSPKFRADLHDMPLRDGAVSALVCIHVLEHVSDDKRAIGELHRVLAPGGRAIIMIPLGMHLDRTVEFDPAGPLLFGHVRDYSPHDAPQRLTPFEVETVTRDDFLSAGECRRYAIPDSEILYLCRRRTD